MKILVIQMKMIGDVLTSSILFEALRKEFPEAELHYLIDKHTLPVVENNPNIDKVILGDQPFYKLSKKVKSEKYFAVIDVYSNLETALINGRSGAKFKIAYDKPYTRPLVTHVFSRNIEAKTAGGAAVEKRLRLLSPLSENIPTEIKPKIFLREEEIESAKQKLETSGIDLSKRLYMIGTLGSSEKKTYPLNYLAKLLDHIIKKTNANLIFNYIPDQRKQVEQLYGFCNSETQKNIHLNVYGDNLRDFLALTYHCNALIGNEGGAVNMAKALNIPTFAIFSPQINKENWNMYEDGKKNVSVHLRDFFPAELKELSKKEIAKKAGAFYGLLKPNLIFAKLEAFLKEVT